MLYEADHISYQLANLHLEGNIIPHAWYKKISFKNGKPYLNACVILSEILYWYRPVILKDERGNIVLKKKYRSDLLQKSYEEFENLIGLSKTQCRDALVHLEELNLVKRVFRNLNIDGRIINDVMYIQIFPDEIKELTHIPTSQSTPPFDRNEGGLISSQPPSSPEITTNTEITTKITQRKEREEAKPPPPPHPLPKKTKKEKPEKKSYRENISLTEGEYQKLLDQYGQQKLDWMLDHLEAKKGANGYAYNSDYHVLLPANWVNKAYTEQVQKGKIELLPPDSEKSKKNKSLCEHAEAKLQHRFSSNCFFNAGPASAILRYDQKDFKKEYDYQAFEPKDLKEILLKDLEICFPGGREILLGQNKMKTGRLLNQLAEKFKFAEAK